MSEQEVAHLTMTLWALFGLIVCMGFRRTMGKLPVYLWIPLAVLMTGPVGLALALIAGFFYLFLSIPEWLANLETYLEHKYYNWKYRRKNGK